MAQPDICVGGGEGARHPEGPQLLKAPSFNFLLGFWSLHFANMIKRVFVKFCRTKGKMPALWGLPTYDGGGARAPVPPPPGSATEAVTVLVVYNID